MTAPGPQRDVVDGLIAAAVATADRDLADAPRPAFAGVVARAHRLDPAQIPRRWLAAADDPPPPWPADESVDDRHRDAPHRGRWIALALAAAAVALLAFGVQQAIDRTTTATAFQAGAQNPPPPLTAPERPQPPARETTPPDPAPSASPLDQTTKQPPHDAATHTPRTHTADPTPRESLDALLARLDDEAEACMQAGDHAGADARYKEIVQRGGRRVQVELAYADRFHLARLRGDDGALRKLWTAYLARFPRGQFADDARGGLCRLTPADEQPTCWRDYLADFPAGSFAADARTGGAP